MSKQWGGRERRVKLEEGENAPLVPFVPFTCPNKCARDVYTYGVRGRIRYHRCNACGQIYRSLQCSPADVSGFTGGVALPQDGPDA